MLLVTVVVTYNQEDLVVETLDSIYEQTYSPLELIISDDCSKDNTVSVVENWVSLHRDRFAEVEINTSPVNTGVSANGNRGLSATHGKYFQIIAGDDLMFPEAIEEKVKFVKEKKQIMLCAK